ncbi:MAG: efflux RND transporter periplasmic adaptor subunit [Sphingobacteriales bacterium]
MKEKMKSIKTLSPFLLIVFLLMGGCKQKPVATTQSAAIKYTCPMHHQIIEDQPGFCPICGMALVKKSGQATESAGIDINTVLQPVNSTVISSINTITPQQKDVPVNINADGFIDYDARTFNNIAARFAGRIEKLYIKYSFEEIHKGERLFDIYSADMVSAQQDLIYLEEHSPEESELIRAAEQKLLLLGLSQSQLKQVEKSHKAFYSLPVFSPYDGHVHDRSHSQNVVMTETNTDQSYAENMPLSIKEGMYVEQGQTLFNVVDPHRLWAIIKVKNTDLANLKLHQPVSMTMPDMPGMILNGKVDFIGPFLQNGDKATLIRVYLHNMDHELKVNSLVKAVINAGTKSGLWIPRAAMTDLGQHKIVWLKQDGLFKVQPVEAGLISGDNIIISKGLSAQDTIAANAQYLTDSESFIKTKAHE